MRTTPAGRILIAAGATLLAACADSTGTPTPTATVDPTRAEFAVSCTASTVDRTVRCGAPVSAASRNILIGGQNVYVTLASSNVAVNADTFAFDVTVTNLIPQPLGTTNGSTPHATGVRVFFHSGPTANVGSVSVANPDGTGTFTQASQPYFQYAGMLEQDATSAVKRWKLQFGGGATTINFTVLVSAEVQYPNGYIDDNWYVLTLDPAESRTLTATPRSAVGNASADPVSWASDAPATVAVAGNQATAGASNGFADLTPSAGGRPALWLTAASVCQSVVVANGHSSAQSIAASDCFSSYGSPNGRPTTSYYADLFRVTLTAGQTVTVTMDSGNDLDTYLLLAAPNTGFVVAGNDDDDDNVLGVGSKMIYTATVSGVHVIEASTFNGLDTGTYTLGVTIS